jgi:hypothetical protein
MDFGAGHAAFKEIWSLQGGNWLVLFFCQTAADWKQHLGNGEP